MKHRGLVGWLLLLLPSLAGAGEAMPFSYPVKPGATQFPPPRIPLNALTPKARQGIQTVYERPTLVARGPCQVFNAQADMYAHLMAHPDQTVKLWRQIGAKVADIDDQGSAEFLWSDSQGSEVRWQSISCGAGLHLWYAEGKVKAARLLPAASFKAVLVMTYTVGRDDAGKPAIQHQTHFALRADSRTMALAAKMLGNSAPRLAEQYLGQLQTFYGGLAWYLTEDEQRARKMFQDIKKPFPLDAAGRAP